MEQTLFSELELTPELAKAVQKLGFESATPIQSQTIPLIRGGGDVIGRSQTGTGKTFAFAIPAIEKINTDEDKPTVQVLILCPTRELAQQCGEEIAKLCEFTQKIHTAEVFGGAAMDRQIRSLKKANIVIGTPGRVMDHMRRGTLKLDDLKVAVLDEADEMLSMGFKEDIETILKTSPENRQTVLFSATMPKAILALTKQFQKNPQLVEINKNQVTIDKIQQNCVSVPMGRKKDALRMLLKFYNPKCAMIFCNTKKMVDELCEYLLGYGVSVSGLHGDMQQSQRTSVMNSFKQGAVAVLIATDVAARGIDVNDIEYVINYDIPQSTEYYVHRIGRTGRAGKNGCAVTICSGRRQVALIQSIAREVKSAITETELPTAESIRQNMYEKNMAAVETALAGDIPEVYTEMAYKLIKRGHEPADILAAALALHFSADDISDEFDNMFEKKSRVIKAGGKTSNAQFEKIAVSIGRSSRVAPNHIVGAITERTELSGGQIGKIEIYDEFSVVSIESGSVDAVLEQMLGCRICGMPVTTARYAEKRRSSKSGSNHSARSGARGGASRGDGHAQSRRRSSSSDRAGRRSHR